jgi:hypothetical protein
VLETALVRRPCGCGGVSVSSGSEAGVNSKCHGYTGGVTGHQGHVVPNPQVVLIYWDQYFTNTPAAVTSVDQFLTDLASGGYWDGLTQYGVRGPSLNGHFVIDMTTYPTPNSQNPGVPFSESQMQNQLITWLDNGVVTPKPAGDEADLVYLIVAPSDTTLPGLVIKRRAPAGPGRGSVRLSRENAGVNARVLLSGGSPVWCSVKGWLTSYL